MNKPTTLPRWADNGDGTPVNQTAPTAGTQDTGYSPEDQLPAQIFNWLFFWCFQWIAWLGQADAFADAALAAGATNPSGVDKTGYALEGRNNEVRLRGSVAISGAAVGGQLLFTLPAGFRPILNKSFVCAAGSGGNWPVLVLIDFSTGAVPTQAVSGQSYGSGTIVITLDGIRFRQGN